jgi:hypothetical protein
MDCSDLTWLVPLTIIFMWVAGYVCGKARTEQSFVRTLKTNPNWKPPQMALRPLDKDREWSM